MGALHELRQDYRHYRADYPEYRLLFLLADLLIVGIKLAVFAGFLFLCWYIVSRNPYRVEAIPGSGVPSVPVATGPVVTGSVVTGSVATGPVTTVPVASASRQEAIVSPELTPERIALLKEVAGQENPSSDPAKLLGSAAPDSVGVVDSNALVTASFDQGQGPVVQVAGGGLSGYAEVDEIPTVSEPEAVVAVNDTPPADFFVPSGSTKDGRWVLEQSGGDYTVQVALTVNVDFLARFAKQLPAGHTAAIYPERLNGKGNLQYSLSFGTFSNKQAAEDLLSSLPTSLTRYGAHTRSFEDIQRKTSEFIR